MSDRKELPLPLREALAEDLPAESLDRLWQTQARRLEPRESRGRTAVIAFAAAAIAVAAFFVGRESVSEVGAPVVRSVEPRTIDRVLETASERRVVSLEDGSWIALAPRTRLEVIEQSREDLRLQLSRGRVQIEVRPGGERRWIVESELGRVIVVGTRFSVEADDERLRVRVLHGAVRVMSPWIDEGVRVLTAGERVAIERAAPVETTQADHVPAEPVPRRDPVERAETAAVESADELFEEADTLRRDGRVREAVDRLERIVARFPSSPDAALALFTLGRIYDDVLDDDARAITALERARAIGLPGAISAEADQRLERLRGPPP